MGFNINSTAKMSNISSILSSEVSSANKKINTTKTTLSNLSQIISGNNIQTSLNRLETGLAEVGQEAIKLLKDLSSFISSQIKNYQTNEDDIVTQLKQLEISLGEQSKNKNQTNSSRVNNSLSKSLSSLSTGLTSYNGLTGNNNDDEKYPITKPNTNPNKNIDLNTNNNNYIPTLTKDKNYISTINPENTNTIPKLDSNLNETISTYDNSKPLNTNKNFGTLSLKKQIKTASHLEEFTTTSSTSLTELTGNNTSIPTSSSPILSSEDSSSRSFVPLGAGLGAASLAGIGTKVCMDKHEKEKEDDKLEIESWPEKDDLEIDYQIMGKFSNKDYLTPADELSYLG